MSSRPKIAIVNTKSANFNSLVQALNRLGVEANITDSISALDSADKLILPGVGTASAVMSGLLQVAIDEIYDGKAPDSSGLCDFILSTKKPLLGICLGMQVQAQASEEVPLNGSLKQVKTLGLVPGFIHKLNVGTKPLPHMGWNQVEVLVDHPLFANIERDAFFYFVHSFGLDVGEYTIASCTYGQKFSAAIAKDNFMGVQFHPEKSGAVGAQLLKNFVEL